MLSDWEMILRLLVASAFGSAIGFERERLLWAAGLRTHMLVCVGSCLIIIVSAYGFNDVIGKNIVLDPSRIAAQVVSGVGFLGAGTILFRGEAVKGLTTAASLWAVAAIGLAVGSGLFVAALAGTVIVLIVLAGIKPLEERYRRRNQTRSLSLLTRRGVFSLDVLKQVAGPFSHRVQQFVMQQSGTEDIDEVEITFARVPEAGLQDIIRKLKALPSVTSADTPELS
ncbi:MgtC/SapB family protein [Lichenifustis flavocetrariae]|uniref:Protein MgtC n=1 Tax=Lichenifustis flavocetrariae TaxID=2949735 RepID=A0AA41Z1X2_9HYPH|nr:MgtC/SapB family protein [Lichenifustis flavocetrariae]MCW6507767.1 MgtC/SapB family protein [Lichenifustis flavocetrariae]